MYHFKQMYLLSLLIAQDRQGGLPRRNTDKTKDFPSCQVDSAPLYITRLPRYLRVRNTACGFVKFN